jgi:hypothetical protein
MEIPATGEFVQHRFDCVHRFDGLAFLNDEC